MIFTIDRYINNCKQARCETVGFKEVFYTRCILYAQELKEHILKRNRHAIRNISSRS